MSPKLARQFILDAQFDTLDDLLAPAIAVRPRVLYASEPKRKRGRWLDWLLKAPSDGPAVETVPVLDEHTLPVGASRFDSVPDVPVGFEWPCHSDGSLLECLAQIDLSEIARETGASALPAEGWLLFFAGEGEETLEAIEGHVIHIEPQPLARWSTYAPRKHIRQTCRLEFESIFNLPDAQDYCVSRRIDLSAEAGERYVALQEKLTDGARHYLLGYPRAIQGNVRAEVAEAEAKRSRRAVRPDELGELGEAYQLLLQLDSDDDGPGWMWGDAGSLYFVIHKEDLARRRFDRTRLLMQCC